MREIAAHLPREGDYWYFLAVNEPNPIVPTNLSRAIAALIATVALSACAAAPTASGSPDNAVAPAAASLSVADRDLTPAEKKILVEAIAPSLRDAGAAKYRWTKFPTVPPSGDDVPYCATVDAKSPYAAYNGHQSYIVNTKLTGGYITGASMGLIAGGKDAAIVTGMCAKHGLDPNKAS
jgi:hypothetical protein